MNIKFYLISVIGFLSCIFMIVFLVFHPEISRSKRQFFREHPFISFIVIIIAVIGIIIKSKIT